MTMVKSLRFPILCGLVCVGSLLAFRAFQPRSSASGPKSDNAAQALLARHPVKPFFATFEERLQKAGRVPTVGARSIVGIRDDGSKVEKNDYLGALPITKRQLYLPGGVQVTINETLRFLIARRTGAWDPNGLGRLDPESGCQMTFAGRAVNSAAGPEEAMLGFKAVHLTSAGKGGWDHWLLPDVECAEVRRLATFTDEKGAVTDTSDLVSTSLKLGEPPAELFQIPRDYQQVSPSEAAKRTAAYSKTTPPEAVVAMLAKADLDYGRTKVEIKDLP